MAIKKDAAVILSGGGAYAAYEIGVMRALFEGKCVSTKYQPLDPGVVTGTSAGAVNAALLASRAQEDAVTALEYAENIWRKHLAAYGSNGAILRFRLSPAELLPSSEMMAAPLTHLVEVAQDAADLAVAALERGAQILLSEGSLADRLIGAADLTDLMDEARFSRVLREVIDVDGIGRSERAIRIAATNWTTGQLQVFENKELAGPLGHDAIRASAAIPGIFKPVQVGSDVFADGALRMNTPIKPALRAGASELHMIYLDPDIRNMPRGRMQSLVATLERALAINFAAVTEHDLERASDINQGLAAIAGEIAGVSTKTLTRVASLLGAEEKAYRPVTIHRYRPRKDLGQGLGILNFSADNIAGLIELGLEDTLAHNCETSGCILPARALTQSAFRSAP